MPLNIRVSMDVWVSDLNGLPRRQQAVCPRPIPTSAGPMPGFSPHMKEPHHFSLFTRQKIAVEFRPVSLSLRIQFHHRRLGIVGRAP